MRNVLFWLVVAAGACLGSSARADYQTIWDNGPSSNRVDIVFLGDGYLAADLTTTYPAHINMMLEHMFLAGEDPFPRYRNFFNVHRIDVVSNERGADIAPQGIFRDTALDARYYWDGSTERLLYVDQTKAYLTLFQNLAGAPFAPEMSLVTVNDTKYGGGGGGFAVFAGGNDAAAEIALHELGHSFAGLADQYGGNPIPYAGPEPSAPDVTIDPSGQKWSHWLGYDQPGIGVIGAYEGGYYHEEGIFRPSNNSKMRSLNRPFDAVGREQIILDLYGFVDPLDDWLNNSGILDGKSPLWVDAIDPDVIDIEWYVNGRQVPGAVGETFALSDFGFGSGTYEVMAKARDNTEWVRIELDKLQQSVRWTVHLVPEPPAAALAVIGVACALATVLRRRVAPCGPSLHAAESPRRPIA